MEKQEAYKFYDPKIDYAFKRVFATEAGKRRLCSLLNSILQLTGENQISKLEVKNGEALSPSPLGKLAIFDVHCEDEKGHKFIVEMQKRSYPDMLKRAAMYVARLYSDQQQRGQDYRELKPVILVALLSQPSTEVPVGIDIVRTHLITEKETGLVRMHDMKWYYVYIGNFQKEEKDLSNLLEHWFYFLSQTPHLLRAPMTAPPEIQDAYHEMERSIWTDSDRLAYDQSLFAIMDDKSSHRDSYQKGIKEGIKESILKLLPILDNKALAKIFEISEYEIKKIRDFDSDFL